MANKIHVLPEEVISRIAAGEVIERPASVLKELVENALDAGARRVDVEIAGGGRGLIRVTDDGSGMSAADLALCVLPHATSKLASADDLTSLCTLGFRGEALPSIAAVSKFSITSRLRGVTQAENAAWRIELPGAQRERPQPRPAAGPCGTTVEVRDLFYNLPARAKFLKGLATEGAACIDTFLRLALTRPDAAFALSQERHEIFACPPVVAQAPRLCGTAEGGGATAGLVGPRLPLAAYFQRARAVLGRSNSQGLLEIVFEESSGVSGYRLYGLLSPPAISRPTRACIYLNVNGRPVKDRTLTSALLEACRYMLPAKRYPIAVLYLELPPLDMDVNVHPTKAEVRFRLPGLVYALFHHAVRGALGAQASSPPPDAAKMAALPTPLGTQASSLPPDAAKMAAPQTKFDLWPRAQAEQGTPVNAVPSPLVGEGNSYGHAPLGSGPLAVGSVAILAVSGGGLEARAPSAEKYTAAAGLATAPFRVLGQARGSYIVIEDDRGLKVIDQHALHERVLFEEFMRRSAGQTRGDAQGLLIAETLELTPVEAAIFPEAEDVLAQLGFEVEVFGPRAVAVRAVPAILKSGSAALVRDVLDALVPADDPQAGGRKPYERSYYREKAAYTVACKGAIKAGERLTMEQMTALVAEYRKCAGAAGFTCPHGRPVALELSWDELKRAVNRR